MLFVDLAIGELRETLRRRYRMPQLTLNGSGRKPSTTEAQMNAEKTTRLVRSICAAICMVVSAGFIPAVEQSKPISIHPQNPHYFLFRGKAIVLITSGEHYGAVFNGDFDDHRYLETIERDGLNFTRIFGGEYVEVPGKSFGIQRNDLAPGSGKFIAPWARSQAPGYAGGGNKFDLEQWNPEYFRRFHDFLAEAGKRGIVVEVTLFSAHYDVAQWNLSAFNPANNVNRTTAIDWKDLHTAANGNISSFQDRYARKLVSEANGYDNVIFEIQNEPWSDRPVFFGVINPYLFPPNRNRFPNSIDLPDDRAMLWQQHIVSIIVDQERSMPNHHLISQNYANFRFPVREVIPAVSILSFHYAYPEAATWNYGLGIPISCDETGFLGHEDDAYRRQAWNFMLSGGAVFDGLDYSFNVGNEDGLDTAPNGPGGGSRDLRRQLRVLLTFLNSLPLADLHPDASVVQHAGGTIPRVLASPGREYAIYLDGDGPVDVTLDIAPGNYEETWIDVKTGSSARSARVWHAGGTLVLHSPAFQDGIALRLQRKP